MPIGIHQLRDALRRAPDNAQVTLTTDITTVNIRSGRIAMWIGKHRTAANRQTIDLFIESLRAGYGHSIASQVTRSTFVEWARQRGEPLTVRHIRDMSNQAARIKATEPRADYVTRVSAPPPRRLQAESGAESRDTA